MLQAGVYKWDREGVKQYIQRHGAEPLDDGVDERIRGAPGLFQLIDAQRGLYGGPPVLDARVVVHGDGMWQLRQFVSARENTRLLGEGEWRQVGDSVEFSLRACDAWPNVDGVPVSFDIEGDLLRLNRTLAGSLYGLLGFRLVSPLPEPKGGS